MNTEWKKQEEIDGAVPGSRDWPWLLSGSLVTAIAAFLRFFWLDLKPFHHDEGVNGFFLTTLYNSDVYRYDPSNYHGPTLYYISLAFAKVFGLETIPVRASVAIFGVLTVVLALFLKKYIGRIGSLFAALFLALSPGMVFISRYFIHEIFFVFLSLAIVVSILFFLEKRKVGIFAIFWMALILLVCFLPSSLNLATKWAGENTTALWSYRIGLFIFEAVLVFFVMRMLIMWNGGRPIYILLASASAALMFATKETAFITLGTMIIACLCVWMREQITSAAKLKKFPVNILVMVLIAAVGTIAVLRYKLPDIAKEFGKWANEYTKAVSIDNFTNLLYILILLVPAVVIVLLYRVDTASRKRETELESDYLEPSLAAFRENSDSYVDRLLLVVAATVIFVYITVLFFSSFFSFPEGVGKAFEAYAVWTKTGSKDHTQNGFWGYLKWLMRIEAPILLLSAAGTVIALIKARHRFAIFAGFWAFGLFTAYSLIPYKTPWLALSFLLPMCIAAGYTINELFASENVLSKITSAALAIAATCILAYQTYDINFVRYDDNDVPYIYAHTRRQYLDMIKEIDRYAEKSGKGKDTAVQIVSPDYWPMVWDVKDYTKAVFHGIIVDAGGAELIVAKKKDQDDKVIEKYSAEYKFVAMYALRPGVDLVLLVRKDLAEPDTKELYRIREVRGN